MLSARKHSRRFSFELEILKKTCQVINTPRSLAVFLLASAGEYKQLLDLSIRPDDYDDPHQFGDDYLVTEMLKKSRSLDVGYDLEAIAFSKWRAAEDLCAESNERLSDFSLAKVSPTFREGGSVIARAIEICHQIVGPLTRRTLDRIHDNMDFGPGATLGCRGVITRGRKFSGRELTTTSQLLGFGLFFLPQVWKDLGLSFKVVEENELMFVPKTAKTHRAITVETDLGIYFQKGIGRVLRDKLRNWGLDLDHSWEINKQLASVCYKTSGATVDLSSASDTISFELVRLFLPSDWFEILTYSRPEFTRYGEQVFELEKFSGMGNGYTFELETLIFFSVLLAAKEIRASTHQVIAFGDDLIMGTDILADVIKTLNFLGFSVNREKTFGKGLFHESCGGDFFRGVNVRPFYLRAEVSDDEEVIRYKYGNAIRRYAHRRNNALGCDKRFLPAWLSCLLSVPKSRRFRIPEGYGDVGFIGNFDEATPRLARADGKYSGWNGYFFHGMLSSPVSTTRFASGAYISALRSPTSFTKGCEPLRGRVRKAKKRQFYTLRWPELGPWC